MPLAAVLQSILSARSRRALALALFGLIAVGAAPARVWANDTTPEAPVVRPAADVSNAASLKDLFEADVILPSALALDAPGATAAIQNEPNPKPKHTGLAALVFSTASDFKAFPRRKSTYVILAIGAGAAALAHPVDDDLNSHLAGKGIGKVFAPGKYLGYGWVQAGVAIGTYAIGRYAIKSPEGRTNRISHVGFDLLRANLLVQALTYGVKFAAQRDRPDGQCCSFPSGHASVTFASAAVLERHFGYRNAWPTFVIAGYVAASRLHDNRHFLSDVLFGSALGLASGWTVVGRHGRDDYSLMMVPVRRGAEIAFAWTPGAKMAAVN